MSCFDGKPVVETPQAAMRRMAEQLEREIMSSLTANTAPQEPTTLNVEKFLEDCRKWELAAKRNQIIFVVDLVHPGPPLEVRTAGEGIRFEMSWQQANELHKHWPMRLRKVISEHVAEFVPALSFIGEFVPAILPMPPYELPPDESQNGAPPT